MRKIHKKVSSDEYNDEPQPFPRVDSEPEHVPMYPMREGDVEIKVTYEGTPPKNIFKDTVHRVINEQKKGTVEHQKSKDQSNKSAKWSAIMQMMHNTNVNAKTFLGIGENVDTSRHKWNERTLRAMKNNLFFGGVIDDTELDSYLENENFDETDNFYLYKNNRELFEKQKNISLIGLAYGGIKSKFGAKPTDIPVVVQQPYQEDEPLDQTNSHGNQSPKGRLNNAPSGLDEVDLEVLENEAGPWDACNPCAKTPVGFGFFDRLCDNNVNGKHKELLKHVIDHRPYFTYWVSFVQVIVCIVSLIAYGLAPIGFSSTLRRGLVTTINLEKQMMSHVEKENFWIGPRVADLVHLGAKYSPCMRLDHNIYEAIELDKKIERETACCIRSDRGGCVQASREDCSKLLSVWHKRDEADGTVCGLDERFCEDKKLKPWTNDLSNWPVCEKANLTIPNTSEYDYMKCEIIGRPCCIGVQGECIITTREDCDLRRGYFHDNAFLCAQVDCMQGVCGMIEFLNTKKPDQIYRLFTSIFIHAGIIQLLVTLFFHWFFLRDVEKMAGCLRVSIIYFLSGIIGNLASATFLPYQAEVGPSGAQFGILALIFVNMFNIRKYYKNIKTVFLKMSLVVLALFAFGFLPMIDNYANIFGFICGLALSFVLAPTLKIKEQCKRIVCIIVGVVLVLVLAIFLIVLFYTLKIDDCKWCKFISCPWGPKLCLEMDFNITRLRHR